MMGELDFLLRMRSLRLSSALMKRLKATFDSPWSRWIQARSTLSTLQTSIWAQTKSFRRGRHTLSWSCWEILVDSMTHYFSSLEHWWVSTAHACISPQLQQNCLYQVFVKRVQARLNFMDSDLSYCASRMHRKSFWTQKTSLSCRKPWGWQFSDSRLLSSKLCAFANPSVSEIMYSTPRKRWLIALKPALTCDNL